MTFYRVIAVLAAALTCWAGPAIAGSTINPNVPAQNSPLQSAPIRGNFAAAYNDINALTGMGCTGTLVIFQLCATTSPNPYQLKIYDGTTLVQWGTLDPTAHKFTSIDLTQTNIWTGDNFFTSGRPWCDVRGRGAVGNGIAADKAAFDSCAATLTSVGGGIMNIPSGYYCIAGYVSPVGIDIQHVGAGEFSTALGACGTDSTVVTLSGALSTLENILVNGKGINNDTGSFGATTPAILVASTAGGARLINVRAHGGTAPVKWAGNDGIIFGGNYSQSFTNANLLVQGSNSAGLKVSYASFDQGYPCSPAPSPGYTISAWTNAHVYATGSLAFITSGGQNYVVQACTGGTSGGVTPTLKNYGLNITDNTVVWQLVSNFGAFAVQCDTGCTELFLTTNDIGCVCTSVGMTNTLAGTAPSLMTLLNNRILGITGVLLSAGADVRIAENEIYGCLQAGCSAIGTNAAWIGLLEISGNKINVALAQAVNITVGSWTQVVNNRISNSGNGVAIGANLTDFTIEGNIFVANTTNVTVAAGTSDRYRIAGNTFSGGGNPTDGGTGINKTVEGGARTLIGSVQEGDLPAATGSAYWQHSALSSAVATNFALLQNSAGSTAINAPAGQVVDVRIANATAFRFGSDLSLISSAVTGGAKGAGTINIAGPYYTAGVQNLIPIDTTLDLFVNPNTGSTASCKDGTLTCGAGNDTTGTGTSALPWATIQKCVDELTGKYFFRKAQATCWVADNTNITQAVIVRPYHSNTIYQGLQPAIRGNCATPGNTVIKGASTGAVFSTAAMAQAWTIQGFDIAPTSAGDTGYFSDWFGNLNVGNTRFTSATSIGITSRYNSAVEIIANGGAITCAGSITIAANMAAFANAFANSTILGQGAPGAVTVTLTGTPAWSNAFAVAQDGGYIDLQSLSFSGASTGSRYSAANASRIVPAGTALPGNAAGQNYIYLREPSAAAGTSTIVATATAGAAFSLPTAGGTFAVAANAPLSLSAAGVLTTAPTPITNSLGADVALNNTANYFDGPSVAQGTSGTWWAAGTVELLDGSAATYSCKLWDGTTVMSSSAAGSAAGVAITIALSGYIVSPAGNIRISCKDFTTTAGNMKFNTSGTSKDSTVSAVRIQ
jgi:parallel beta helix pectate lyase-like protein